MLALERAVRATEHPGRVWGEADFEERVRVSFWNLSSEDPEFIITVFP